MNIFVSNINFRANDDQLHELFAAKGEVASAKIIKDKETGRSRGFGFVEMPNEDEAQRAIDDLNQFEFQGKVLNVSVAKPREERPRTGGFNRNRE